MSAHTPGPWHTAGEQGVQIRSQRDQIAKVWCMRGNEWKANARLIAAAPDLLEALREYRAAILFAQDKQALMSAIKSADDKARAAIAKAEEA